MSSIDPVTSLVLCRRANGYAPVCAKLNVYPVCNFAGNENSYPLFSLPHKLVAAQCGRPTTGLNYYICID